MKEDSIGFLAKNSSFFKEEEKLWKSSKYWIIGISTIVPNMLQRTFCL